MKIKRRFEVTVRFPDGVGVYEMRQYIEEAIITWCKSFDPDCQLFELDQKDVKVKLIRQEKSKP